MDNESYNTDNGTEKSHHVTIEEIRELEGITGRYMLPPRSNRGVSPKRYSPSKEVRHSRYPLDNFGEGNLSEIARAFMTKLYTKEVPKTAEEALKSERCTKAMEEEIKALTKSGTWEKCQLPEGKKTVGCRWVFTIKHKPDGTTERYKVCLVAKGYTQTYRIDYLETFSLAAKIDAIRVLLSIAANKGWPLHQIDVKNAFLYGDLKEEVYMEMPPSFSDKYQSGEVCHLRKSLYGLKQSPRAWFGRFTTAMKNYGFI